MEPIIQVKNVNFEYSSHEGELTAALIDVSLDINKGEFVAIIGHNGSGKSTLAKHFNALLRPGSGDVIMKTRFGIFARWQGWCFKTPIIRW